MTGSPDGTYRNAVCDAEVNGPTGPNENQSNPDGWRRCN